MNSLEITCLSIVFEAFKEHFINKSAEEMLRVFACKVKVITCNSSYI